MTQGENVNPCPRKKTKKRRKISNQRESKKGKERKFPIKEWEKAKRKERKFPIKEWEKVKKKKKKKREEEEKFRKFKVRGLLAAYSLWHSVLLVKIYRKLQNYERDSLKKMRLTKFCDFQ